MRSSPAAIPSHHQRLSWPSGGARRRGRSGRARRLCRRGDLLLGRPELQHAEGHPADLIPVRVAERGARVDEVAGAQRRGLLGGDRLDHRARHHLIAGPQVARVALSAVGRDDRRIAGAREQLVQLELAIAGRVARLGHLHALEDPGLQHRRRRHDSAVHRLPRERGIGVHRIAIAHGLAPVPDHRRIDEIRTDLGGPITAPTKPRSAASSSEPLALSGDRHVLRSSRQAVRRPIS